MKNLSIWIITLIIAIVFVVGVAYYKILDAVVNSIAFIISLTIIFLILILIIVFSHQDNKRRKFEKPQIKNEKPKIEDKKIVIKKTSPKKSRAIKKK